MKVICGERKQEYFFKRDWTTQITLIRLMKLGFARKRRARGTARSPHRVEGPARRAPRGMCDTMAAKARRVN
jgi:hypothetical protein